MSEYQHLHQIEGILIGSVMMSGSAAFATVAHIVSSQHFHLPTNRVTWAAFELLSKEGRLTDAGSAYLGLMSISADSLGKYPAIPVIDYIDNNLHLESGMVGADLAPYAKSIRGASIQRAIVAGLGTAQQMASRADVDMAEVSGLLTGLMRMPSMMREEDTLASVWDDAPPSADRGGLSWEIVGMDEHWPLCPGRFTVLAAPPGTGKTVMATQAGLASAKNGETVAFVSLEMSSVDLKERIRRRYPEREDWMANFRLPDRRGITVDTLGATIERLAQQGARLVIVDYLQRVAGRDGIDEITKINEVSRACADAALRCNVAVMGLSQLNREGTKHKEKPRKPVMADLKGSSSLEQDADYILFIWDEFDQRAEVEQGQPKQLTLVVGKNRHGSDYRNRPLVLTGDGTRFIPGQPVPPQMQAKKAKPNTQYRKRPQDDENLFG